MAAGHLSGQLSRERGAPRPIPVDFRDFQLIDHLSPRREHVLSTRRERTAASAVWRGGSCCTIAVFRRWKMFWDRAANCTASRPSLAPAAATASRPSFGIATREPSIPSRHTRGRNTIFALCSSGIGKRLGPKLAGKLHVFMGDEDTFYLEGATQVAREVAGQARQRRGRRNPSRQRSFDAS